MKGKFKNITFVIPEPTSFVSGGNIYNLHFLKAIQGYDPTIRQIDFEVFSRLTASEKTDLYFIDTIYFEQLKQYQGDLSSSILIVHLLESLNQEEASRHAYFEKEERMLLDRFRGFLSTSPFTHAYLQTLDYPKAFHFILPPALTFKPRVRQKETTKINALMVNNLMERKGVVEFLEALKETNITKEQFELTIIGNDTLEPAYAQKCKGLLADPKIRPLVRYEGVLPHSKVKQFFEEANLYISAASMETFGIALQEAVAYRMPILAVDGGSVNFHIEEFYNGYLFDSSADLVDTLEELCGVNKEFKSLVESAWQFRKFEDYTWDTVVKTFVHQLTFI